MSCVAAQAVLLPLLVTGAFCLRPIRLWSVKEVVECLTPLGMPDAIQAIIKNSLDGKSILRINLEADLGLSRPVAQGVQCSHELNLRNDRIGSDSSSAHAASYAPAIRSVSYNELLALTLRRVMLVLIDADLGRDLALQIHGHLLSTCEFLDGEALEFLIESFEVDWVHKQTFRAELGHTCSAGATPAPSKAFVTTPHRNRSDAAQGLQQTHGRCSKSVIAERIHLCMDACIRACAHTCLPAHPTHLHKSLHSRAHARCTHTHSCSYMHTAGHSLESMRWSRAVATRRTLLSAT